MLYIYMSRVGIIRRIVAFVLAFIIIFSIFVMSDIRGNNRASADDANDTGYLGTGTGLVSLSSGEGFTWASSHEGYRVVIVDKDGNEVSKVVDILFSDNQLTKVSANNFFTASRVNSDALSTSMSNYKYHQYTDVATTQNGFTSVYMPWPIGSYTVNGRNMFKGRGEELKAWMTTSTYNVTYNGVGKNRPCL